MKQHYKAKQFLQIPNTILTLSNNTMQKQVQQNTKTLQHHFAEHMQMQHIAQNTTKTP